MQFLCDSLNSPCKCIQVSYPIDKVLLDEDTKSYTPKICVTSCLNFGTGASQSSNTVTFTVSLTIHRDTLRCDTLACRDIPAMYCIQGT